MKLKGTSKTIFTINTTLDDINFDEDIILEKPIYFGKYSTGAIKGDKIDEVKIKFKKNVVPKLKYLYHIKKIGGGLKYSHMAYVRLNILQHIAITFFNRFIPWIKKLKNLIKILTIITSIATIYLLFKNDKGFQNIKIISPVEIKYDRP
jgi:hypothetical protein